MTDGKKRTRRPRWKWRLCSALAVWGMIDVARVVGNCRVSDSCFDNFAEIKPMTHVNVYNIQVIKGSKTSIIVSAEPDASFTRSNDEIMSSLPNSDLPLRGQAAQKELKQLSKLRGEKGRDLQSTAAHQSLAQLISNGLSAQPSLKTGSQSLSTANLRAGTIPTQLNSKFRGSNGGTKTRGTNSNKKRSTNKTRTISKKQRGTVKTRGGTGTKKRNRRGGNTKKRRGSSRTYKQGTQERKTGRHISPQYGSTSSRVHGASSINIGTAGSGKPVKVHLPGGNYNYVNQHPGYRGPNIGSGKPVKYQLPGTGPNWGGTKPLPTTWNGAAQTKPEWGGGGMQPCACTESTSTWGDSSGGLSWAGTSGKSGKSSSSKGNDGLDCLCMHPGVVSAIASSIASAISPSELASENIARTFMPTYFPTYYPTSFPTSFPTES